MITASMRGRRLCLAVETEPDEDDIEPFLIAPLPARTGREMSTRYLYASEGIAFEGSLQDDLVAAFGPENYRRADETLSQSEGELLAQVAYFWQMVGGIDAVTTMLSVGEDGMQGGGEAVGKAIAAFRLRMVPLLSQIRHRMESARRMQTAATPDTDSPDGGESSERPLDSPPSDEPAPPTTENDASRSPETPD